MDGNACRGHRDGGGPRGKDSDLGKSQVKCLTHYDWAFYIITSIISHYIAFLRYDYDDEKELEHRNIEYRMAADDPRFDPQIDLHTRLQHLRPLIAAANLINSRFGRKV